MRTSRVATLPCIVSILALAACSSGQSEKAPEPPVSEQASGSSSVAQIDHYHAELALAAQPVVADGGKNILVIVNVTNDGAATFGTKATPAGNVNLGAHAIDAAGKVVDNDLARGSIPEVSPGASVKAMIRLPVAKVLGHRAQLLPVEEGVGWFDEWGTKPLVVGPFEGCRGSATADACDAAGNPLARAPRRE